MSSPYYQPSARYSPTVFPLALLGLVLALAAGWVSAALSAGAYRWFDGEGPLVMGMLMTLFLSILLLVLCSILMRKGQVRNVRLAKYLALAICIPVTYCQWVFWVHMRGWNQAAWPGLLTLLTDPLLAYHALLGTGRGPILAVLGIAGDCVVFIVGPVSGAMSMARSLFCETNKVWLAEESLERRFEAIAEADCDQFVAALEADPDNFRAHLKDRQSDSPSYTTLALYGSPGAESYLSVSTTTETTEDGNVTERGLDVLEYLKISAQVAHHIRLSCSRTAMPTGNAYSWPAPEPDDQPAP